MKCPKCGNDLCSVSALGKTVENVCLHCAAKKLRDDRK